MLVFISLLIPHLLEAQRYPFFNIGIEQGLIQSQVFTMAQDRAGHLWAGTLGGLSCYDGKVFRSFSVRDGLPSNTITALRCDSQRRLLWIGTNRGLSSYDGYRFRNYTFTGQTNPGGNTVIDIAVDASGNLWCIAGKNLYRLQDGKVTGVRLPEGCKVATALTAAKQGGVWLTGVGGSAVYHGIGKSWDSISLGKPFFIRRMYEDANGKLVLLGSPGMLRRRDNGSWQLLLARKSIEDPFPLAMAQSEDGSYWVSTTAGGVLQLRDSTIEHRFAKNTGLSDILIRDLLCDAEGNIWLASNGEGLYRFSGAVFTAVDERAGLSGPQVSCIAQDDNGIIYFGTYDGGMYRYTEGIAKPVSFPGEKASGAINSFLLRGNTLWVGTQQIGLWQYNVDNGSMKRFMPKKLEGEARDMLGDEDGIWVVNGKGLVHIADDSLRRVFTQSAMVEAFTQIGRDSLLLATDEGLNLCTADSIRPFRTGTAADSAQIVCMDYRNGVVWMGTVDDGVFGFALGGGASIHITRRDGLQSDFIYNIYPAPDGSVWAGTGYGICHILLKGGRPGVLFYGRSAGLTGMESNRNAVLPLADGRIWFGTTGGAVLYHPEAPAAEPKTLSLQLQSVLLFGETITDTTLFYGTTPLYGVAQNLHLPWRQNSLTFSFHSVSLSGGETIKYRYRLEGLLAPWSEWSTNSTVTFSALPPGKYELQVQSSTDSEHPQLSSLHYPFEIITPFHKTALFRFLIIAACIVLGIGLQYAAARGKRRRLAQFEAVRREEQARIRQRTAEDFHDEVGNKLTRINVLTNVLRSKIGAAPDATRIIDQIQDNAGQLYSGTRDILWALQPSNDNLYQVMHRIRDFGRDLFGDTDTQFVMDDVPAAWKYYRLPMDASRNLIMIFKEALNNTLKYAGATQVLITPVMLGSELQLTLSDNGEGFDCGTVKRGQGLANMETRAKRLNGNVAINAAKGVGTSIFLRIKIPQNKGGRLNSVA